jgi:transcriptional regulator with XRE-family HTH domain
MTTLRRAFVSARMTALREERGLEVAQLARRMGRPSEAVRSWEGGSLSPAPRTIASIACALDVDPVALLDDPPEDATLEDLRVWAGFETHDMARRLGLGSSVYTELERAPTRPPSPELAARLATVLGVRVDIIYDAFKQLDVAASSASDHERHIAVR